MHDDDHRDRIDLSLCTDCALVYGAGYTDGDLHQQTYGAIALPWDEYTSHVERWDAIDTLILESLEGDPSAEVFTCGLCDAPHYGRAYAAHVFQTP